MIEVLLEDGTVGAIDSKIVEVGDIVCVELHDENGLKIFQNGKVQEILIVID